MPELPEVETIRRQLEKVLIGKRIAKVRVLEKKSFVGEAGMLAGAVVKKVERRGKILIIKLQIPNPKSQKNPKFKIQNSKLMLLVHLKLTGQLIYKLKIKKTPRQGSVSFASQKTPRLGSVSFASQNEKLKINNKNNKYTRVVVEFADGSGLLFRDARKFGWMKVETVETGLKPVSTENIGPDPFERTFTKDYLKRILVGSKRAVKIILMDQQKIAGIGNIYANEALFCAKVDPRTPGKKLADDKTDKTDRTDRTNRSLEKLRRCIKGVLQNGLKYKGASEQWYLDAYGQKGKMQEHFLVYRQTEKPCSRKCGGIIKRISLGGRGTFYCPRCQK